MVGTAGLAKLKDLKVLMLGCRGAGVETSKNLILSNVGGVTVWDPEVVRICDLVRGPLVSSLPRVAAAMLRCLRARAVSWRSLCLG